MSKRKRADSEDDDIDDIDDDDGRSKSMVDQRRLAQFRGIIEQSRTSLATALKLARGFERQKLGRRQKNATKDPQTLLRLREEVIILKQLSLEKTAHNHLVKSLIKSKRIRESPYFCTVYGTDPKLETVQSTAEGNVLGRLFNSNPVKVAMTRIMNGVYEMLGFDEKSTPSVSQPSQKVNNTTNNNSNLVVDTELDPMEITTDEGSGDESEFTSFSNNEDKGVRRRSPSVDDDDKRDMLSNADVGFQNTKRKASEKLPMPSTIISQTPSTTAFLPSLSMGGYYSGDSASSDDEDDDEDDERPNAGPAQPKERKNRRGQRARQQLAEKKFGKNAKHLRNPSRSHSNSNSHSTRDAGWDKRKGAVASTSSGGGGGRGRRPSNHFGRGSGSQGMNGHKTRDRPSTAERKMKPQGQARDDAGPIHPSWEAAKQRKSRSITQVAFAGKKTTFD